MRMMHLHVNQKHDGDERATMYIINSICQLSSLWRNVCWERSGSVVECLTRDQGALGLSLTGKTALWSWSNTHLS